MTVVYTNSLKLQQPQDRANRGNTGEKGKGGCAYFAFFGKVKLKNFGKKIKVDFELESTKPKKSRKIRKFDD